MTLTKKSDNSVSYDESTFYEYFDGKLNAVFFSVWSENYGRDRKIIGLFSNGSSPSRYMTEASFEKYMKTRLNNGHSEFYSTYDEPKLWLVNEPKLSGKRTVVRKPITRKPAARKPTRK